jgi:hypothetical protein
VDDRRERASDQIWGLVCGFAEPLRSNRLLFMLKAYIDDSNMNSPPVSVLGGWVGPAKEWAAFSDCWAEALWMKPRLGYFKFQVSGGAKLQRRIWGLERGIQE